MKFRNPKTGDVFPAGGAEFCGRYYTQDCPSCPLYDCQDDAPSCEALVAAHPYQAARLMGYEVIEDSPPQADQSAKADAGKIMPTLVPPALIEAVAAVRGYGCSKYGDPDNWRRVEPQRYRDALYRHWLAYLKNPEACDPESGLPHLWHLACNAAFLIEMETEHE